VNKRKLYVETQDCNIYTFMLDDRILKDYVDIFFPMAH